MPVEVDLPDRRLAGRMEEDGWLLVDVEVLLGVARRRVGARDAEEVAEIVQERVLVGPFSPLVPEPAGMKGGDVHGRRGGAGEG
ncbi:MAG TPA: hypothetical protein PKA62_15250 [Thermoanaerobaculia bacterium]|nr:hypothetical protein [Thermoanaerobaculia bacterium]